MAEELFKKKISREERIYREATELQEAVSCVLRFENKVAALKSAARKFQKLEDYKDAKAHMEDCRASAAKAAEEGSREVFEEAVRREGLAKSKSDYADAIMEFKRVSRKGDYAEDAKVHIRACRQRIARLESYAVWKRRLTVLAVIAVGMFLFTRTPLYPFAKGYVHQQMGEYKAALVNYRQSGLSWTKDLAGVCYYKMGMEKLEQGEQEEALRLLRKAKKKGNQKAKQEIHRLEKEMGSEEQKP